MLFNFKHNYSQLVAIGITALLSACGGSASTPNNPTVNSTINSSNQSAVTSLGYSGISSVNGQVAMSSLVTGVNVSPANAGPGLLDTLLATSYKVLAAAPQSMVTGVTTTQTLNCSTSGTLQVTTNIYVNTYFSNGDNYALVANNCSENGSVLNGNYSITFNNIQGVSTPTGNWTGTLTTAMTNLSLQVGSAAPVVMNGGMTIGLAKNSSQVGYTVTGNVSASTSGTTITMSNFSYTGTRVGTTYTYSANFTESVSSPSIGALSYTVTTTKPFVQVDGYNPTQGAFTIKAADNTSIIGTVVPTGMQIQLDATGSGNYGASTIIPWNSL